MIRLEDIVVVVVGVVCFALVIVCWPVLRYGVPALFAAIRARYLSIDFNEIMSRIADLGDAGDARSGANGDAGGAGTPMLPHRHQLNDDHGSENASAYASITLRQLPKVELITMLAVQRKDDGSYLWSSNEIKKFVPGADGPIGDVIATVRGKRTPDPPTRSIRRAASGDWEPVR